MSHDTIGDFLTIIRNGILASKRFVITPFSTIKQQIAEILKEEGFIKNVETITNESGSKALKIILKYVDGESVIHELTRISTPGRRVYKGANNLEHVRGKLGISILTTNKGIMTNKKAREMSLGGEVICSVW